MGIFLAMLWINLEKDRLIRTPAAMNVGTAFMGQMRYFVFRESAARFVA
jgi:hypothetical protein